MNHLDAVRLLGLDAPVRPEGEGYGQVVPEDFELLVRALPQGVIAGSVLLGGADVPVRSLEDFTRDTALRLADMREVLGSREQELWLPLHPRPRGMVTWGRTANDGVLLWDTTVADTADWTTVLTDTDFQFWLDLPFSASEFVARAVTGRAEGTPAFETYQEYESGTFWKVADDKRATAMALANRDIGAVEEIVTRVRSIGVPGVRQYAEELLGRAGESFGALPEDYLAVMREFPGGVVAGVRVFSVSARPGAPGLRRLDEDGLFLQWGEVGGRAFGWLTAEDDPEEWRVAYVEPDGSALTCLEDQTFATFLRRRLRGDNSLF
ncbi:hypothetical protein [Streptomyces sp. TLI_105]|uniref:hypothetical protein n=1 Tax=Streptomyces sp. TLI_105 TaxID=1881019 RepID=UPI00089A4C2B|nr:hypothetical protein [Streptomyces sp. TLI_105]SED95555.1 hypothetical protein SAMN05428939_6853 [Streptomyces sp. TLI_105]